MSSTQIIFNEKLAHLVGTPNMFDVRFGRLAASPSATVDQRSLWTAVAVRPLFATLFCEPRAPASGDQGYGGNALSLRATHLTPEQLTEVVKCGRPRAGMSYHDRFAYTDRRCFGHTREKMGAYMPPAGNDFLSNREVEAVVKYLIAKAVGRGPATYEDCVDFWGKDTRECDPMKK
jgi:hypothetical protein